MIPLAQAPATPPAPPLATSPAPPLAVLAELTHRCPMRCVYCSNPLALEPASRELDTATWRRVLGEAAELGALQVSFSGGEPAVRDDLGDLVGHAASRGLYTNLITSGILLDRARIAALAAAGLEHVQLSIQDADAAAGERIGGLKGAHARKRDVAEAVVDAGLAFTVNATVHRLNAARIEGIIALAVELGAGRLEVAHVQYHGWAAVNRPALLPDREDLERVTAAVDAARTALAGRLVIDHVLPDYHARFPKACMGGWGRQFLVIDPSGRVLPCHAATTIPGLRFENVRDASLESIWTSSEAFARFRGTAWMPEPCSGCERREIDWGGCRCQALAIAGDAARTDPVCRKSADRDRIDRLLASSAEVIAAPPAPLVWRGDTAAVRGAAPRD